MEIYILSESVCQKQPLRCVLRPSGAEGGQRGRLPPPPFLTVFCRYALFSDEPFNCALFERSNPKYT